MGLFNRNKNKEVNKQPVASEKPKLPFDVNFSKTESGDLQVEFYDQQADFKQFYDTTRLIVKQAPFNLQGYSVLDCAVSHYGQDDAIMLNDKGQEIGGRKNEYKRVLAQLDLRLLQIDPNYCYMVMKGLLDEKRVNEYLERGLQENPEIPCGMYIGGVRQTEQGYRKFFDKKIGMASHNSELMVEKRRKIKENQKAKMQQEAEELRKKAKDIEDAMYRL